MDEPTEDQPLCPHCLAEIKPHDHFCPACGGPITAHASTDPIGHIYAEGYAYRQAVSGRPRLLVMLGVWAIFGPQVIFGLLFLADATHAQQSVFTVMSEAGLLFMLTIYAAILVKVTANRFVHAEVSTQAG